MRRRGCDWGVLPAKPQHNLVNRRSASNPKVAEFRQPGIQKKLTIIHILNFTHWSTYCIALALANDALVSAPRAERTQHGIKRGSGSTKDDRVDKKWQSYPYGSESETHVPTCGPD